MDTDKQDASDEAYQSFRSMNVPPDASLGRLDLLRRKIGRDLVLSPWDLALRYLGLSLIGYVISLGVCAQNNFGFTQAGRALARRLHELPDPWCPIVCGAVFTGIPFLVCLFWFNRFQHRYLLFKMWWFVGIVPVAMSGLMLILPESLRHGRMLEHQHGLGHVAQHGAPGAWDSKAWILTWLAASVLLPYILDLMVYLALRPRRKA